MSPTIFIADDNPGDQEMIPLAFEEAGVQAEFISAMDGFAAIELLKTVMPNLILVDIKMPIADGFEVLRWLRGDERLCKVPVIVMSSSSAASDRQRATDLGALRFWSKPTKFEDTIAFAASLESVLRPG